MSCGTKHTDRVWLNWEPCGMVCVAITWSIVLYADYVVVGYVILPWLSISVHGMTHILLFNLGAFLGLTSHLKAMCTDPGAVPLNAKPLQPMRRQRHCRRCDAFKPKRAHHCSLCQRCIVKMDHHCPWVNNCVGLGNHKFFLLFIGYIFVISVYALILILARFFSCLGGSNGCMASGGDAAPVLIVIVVVLALLFGLFTFCMACDQMSVVLSNATAIDRLKGEVSADNGGVMSNLEEVFGGSGFSFSWFLPTDIVFNDPEAVKGYCVDDGTVDGSVFV